MNNVITTDGKVVDPDKQPEGILVEIARTFLADVLAGKITHAVVITDGEEGVTIGCTGDAIEVLGLLARGTHRVNVDLDNEGEPE